MAFFAFDKTAYTSSTAPDGSYGAETMAVDLDGDNDLDLITARSFYPFQNVSIPIEVLRNDGTGTFTNWDSLVAGALPVSITPRELVVADFNGDEKPDFFFADHGYDVSPYPGFQNQLLLSTPTGYVNATSTNLPALNDFTHSADAADIDGDGDVDLYVGNVYGQHRISPYILLNDGTGEFTRVTNRLPASNVDLNKNKYTTELFGDFNGDSKPDLFLGGDDSGARNVILRNTGAGKFVAVNPKLPAKPFGPKSVTVDSQVLDINNDGRSDIVAVYTTDYQHRAVQILINKGGFKFANETAHRLDPFGGVGWIKYLHFVDLNDDGALDIITEPAGGAVDAEIRINDGDGVFFTPLNAVQPFTGQALEVGDFNGDTIPDVLAWGGAEQLFLFKGLDEQNYLLDGDDSNNTLHGDALANTMSGGAGIDSISGGAGADVISGDDEGDTLNGGSGDDTIVGGSGRDTMNGGLGADDFVFNLATDSGNTATTRDIITGFKHLEDDIDVSAIASFAWRGKAGFTGTMPELRYITQDLVGAAKDKTIIQADVDGDGHSDFQIQLKGLIKLTADDFIL